MLNHTSSIDFSNLETTSVDEPIIDLSQTDEQLRENAIDYYIDLIIKCRTSIKKNGTDNAITLINLHHAVLKLSEQVEDYFRY